MANPNPRGWRRGDLFIDLARVQVAYRIREQSIMDGNTRMIGYVVLRSSGGERAGELAHGATSIGEFSDEAFGSFLDALEIYRSNR